MILKNLELSGFKSFVDQTAMDFTRGFTAVVGPNGCGKSNISDAVRWVIGEQSTKTLRGTRITDLIFNGTTDRKPVNRAEVTLTLGDVPEGLRIAGVLNASEEIKVTRCFHRSGEGEFYINNVPCRLKDITDLFLDVGISPKVLTVIEQNHVQDIVTSKPEDRRIWIEEAAGVLKFKVRKNEALRKLESAGQNLDRISDIVQELERQVESLKRQAAKAERYKQFQTEIKHLSLNLFGRRIRRLATEMETVLAELEKKTQDKAEKAARVSELETRIEQLRFDLDALVGELNQKKEAVHELSRKISEGEHRIELKRQQIGQAESEIESAGSEIGRMKEEIDGHAKEAEARRTELSEIGGRITEQETLVEGKTGEQSQLKAGLDETERELHSAEEHVLTLWHRMSQKQNEVTALTTRGEQIEARDTKLQEEEARNTEETTVARRREEDAAQQQQEKESRYATCKSEQEAARTARDEAQAALETIRKQVLETKDAYMTQASMLKSLTELRKQFEGYGEGVRALMGNGNGDRLSGLREVLGDVLRAPEEYETALEAVLGGRLQGMIVDSYQDSAEAIRYLREHKTGRGSFIPLNPKSSPKAPIYLNGNPGVIGKALDYVQTSGEYKTLLDQLLADVVLVRDFDTALHLHGQDQFQGTVVTLTGEVIDTEGVVTGGAVAESTEGVLARNRELETRAVEVAELEVQLAQAETREQQHAETLQAKAVALGDADVQVQEAEIARAGGLKDLEQFKQETERLLKKQETLTLERQANKQELEEIVRLKDSLADEVEQVDQDKKRSESRVSELKALAAEQRTLVDQAGNAIHEMQVLLTSLVGKRETLVSEIKRLEQQQEALKQRIRQREGEQGINRDKIEDCEKIITRAEQEIVEQARAKDELAAEITQQEEQLRELEAELGGHDQELRSSSKALQELSEELFRVETRKNEMQIQIQHLEEKAFEDYSVNRDELIHSFTEELDEEETAQQVAELKEKVRKLGDVNLAALSDFQIANERFLFLHQQQEDLTESISTLHQTIENIDQTTEQLFTDTFVQVNTYFKEIFSRLFLGGRAELALTDPENPLESGVEITASPAGKAMHNITLLSGGEKTMTAISLIFALLKVRPSPFCLLDEVDAPLDEANVVRFQEMLKEFAAETQFIIITHNQKTMSFADTLYGVTMEEHGVSKVVSVHLNN